MTSEDIRNHPGAAASSSGDTDSMCFWLKEIALQMALLNEQLLVMSVRPLWEQSVLTPNEARARMVVYPPTEPEILPAQPISADPPKVQYFAAKDDTSLGVGQIEDDTPF